MPAEHPPVAAAEPPVRTSLRLVWLVGLVYVVAAGSRPGLHGRHLDGLALTVTTALAWVTWLTARHRGNMRWTLVGIVLLATSGGALVVLTPVGVAVVGVAGMCAASLLDLPPAAALTAPAVLAATVAVVVTGHPAGVIGGAASGGAAGLAVGMARRQGQQRIRQDAELAVAHERAELEHDRAQVLAERQRLAREVHDVLAHTLSALAVQLEALDSRLDDGMDATGVRDGVGRSRRLVADGLEETRHAVRVLRDDPVDVAEQVAALSSRGRATFRLDGTPRPLPPAAGLALVRVTQEALTNARKHAAGIPVLVTLSFRDAETRLTVDNTRVNASPLAGTGAGYGLPGMRERLELAGGSLTAGPHEGGWRVDARVPA